MAEEIFTVGDLNNWRENKRLPVFVTATCEFGRHDSPLIRSGAEELLIAEKKGAIALLSTGRPVFSNINFQLNHAFIQEAFKRENGQSLTLGEIFKRTKNNSLNGALNRNFSLIGDPSLRLALPELAVQLEELTDLESGSGLDTLNSLRPVSYRGQITDPLTGAAINSFNGNIEVLFTDSSRSKTTLGDESQPVEYQATQSFLHRGVAKVKNGQFEGHFILPESPDRPIREGVLRFYAKDKNNSIDAFGAEKIAFGGPADQGSVDNTAPEIKLSLQAPYDASPIPSTTVEMKAALKDASGIHIGSVNGISIQINDGEKLLLNDYYKAQNGSYTEGLLEFPVSGLREGKNNLRFEAFDNQGNRSEYVLELWVSGSEQIKILSHLLFPNPAVEFGELRLTHNRLGENLLLGLKIYSFSGSEIFSLSRRFPKASSLLDDVSWFFMQGKSHFPAKGTYLYILELRSEADGSSDRKSGKIIIQ